MMHLFAFSTWFGTMIYTTFIFGITAFKNLPRQTFGKLQAKLFPKYFSLGSICLVIQVRPFFYHVFFHPNFVGWLVDWLVGWFFCVPMHAGLVPPSPEFSHCVSIYRSVQIHHV